MKRVMILGALFAVFAASAAETAAQPVDESRFPAIIGFNTVDDADLVGLRFNWWGGRADQITGIDLGLIGHADNFYGFQLNLLFNDAIDVCDGFQIGLVNNAGRSDLFALQAGLWNQAGSVRGFQVGLVNLADYSNGFQIGVINRTEGNEGFQIGAINVIRDSQVPFCPILNIGF